MNKKVTVNENLVISKIYLLRGQKVIIDEDLADMYGVETRRLNEQVKRNINRFPEDFMFHLTDEEYENLKSQTATSRWGGRRKLPYAFTEHGVLMLSSVLSSPTAIQVNIKIMRVYTRLREMLLTHKDILLKLELLERKILNQNEKSNKQEQEIQIIFNTLKQLLNPPPQPRKRIGKPVMTNGKIGNLLYCRVYLSFRIKNFFINDWNKTFQSNINQKINDKSIAITEDIVINKIYHIRGKRVMLDRDLA
jgi:hypothetical protein